MIRVDRAELTKNEIIRAAANRFLNEGYSKTTVNALAKSLNMSTGNITFHFPTKEHMLAELVDMLCNYQKRLIEEGVASGKSAIEAICFELLMVTAACEVDEIAKEFFLACYTSPMCMDIIRNNDAQRAKRVFRKYCADWEDAQFIEAEALVSGIEYATFLTTSNSTSIEHRVRGALEAILAIYNVPEEIRKKKIGQLSFHNYETVAAQILSRFREFVDRQTEQALLNLLARKNPDEEKAQ